MSTNFSNLTERALKKCAPMKKVFIRNDKSNNTKQQKWVTDETESCNLYSQINFTMEPKGKKYQNLQNDFVGKISAYFLSSQVLSFHNLSKNKDNWNFIKEARNTRRTKTNISSLKNSVGERITDKKRIADLLIYRFSNLGESFGLMKHSIDQSSDEASLSTKPLGFGPKASLNA